MSKTREEVITAIQSVSKSMPGKVLTQRHFFTESDVTISDVLRYFPKWSDACREAGVGHDTSRDRIADDILLSDWGNVARSLGHIPSLTEYKVNGSHSRNVFDRFGKWVDIPRVFEERCANAKEWRDVLAIIRTASEKTIRKKLTADPKVRVTSNARRWHEKLEKRPIFGNPIDFRGLRHEPVNEQGVVFLFGMVARELGYLVEAIQSGFPDCEAKRQVSPGQWQPVQIEFEYASKNFAEHGHDPARCDVIVCWKHNWPECPENLEVLALSDEIKNLKK
jgi:hypothetical protein